MKDKNINKSREKYNNKEKYNSYESAINNKKELKLFTNKDKNQIDCNNLIKLKKIKNNKKNISPNKKKAKKFR